MRTRTDSIPRRITRPGLFSGGFMPPGLYGSSLPGTFLRDAINGNDSLDIVTIGDSNALFSYNGDGSGGGWTRGWYRALNALGANTYSSPLMPIMLSGTTGSAQKFTNDDGVTEASLTGWFSNINAPNGSLVRGSASGPTNVTNSVVPATSFKPHGLSNWDYGFIANGNNNQTYGQVLGTFPGGSTPSPALQTWTQPGTAMKYRAIYATQSSVTSTSTRARFNPTAYRVDNGSYTLLATKAQNTYSATGTAITTTDLSFTMPNNTVNGEQAVIVGWNYIGIAYGPCSVMWDCVYRARKGIAVNNLHYGSGQSTSTISDIITGANGTDRTFVLEYFKQLRQRQIDAGGSGRVVVWINYGINPSTGPDAAAVWTAKTAAAISFLQTQWLGAGGNTGNIAFVVSVTHPLDTDYGGTTESVLAANRAAANVWAATQQNTTVIDLSQMYSAAQMTSNGYYAGPGSVGENCEAHLSQAGYYAFALKFCTLLAESV